MRAEFKTTSRPFESLGKVILTQIERCTREDFRKQSTKSLFLQARASLRKLQV